jgi:PKD repeat protein
MKMEKAVILTVNILIVLLSLINTLRTLPLAHTTNALEAKFKFVPVIPYVNEIVRLDASTSTGGDVGIILYRWDFGDNTTGIGVYVEKSYTQTGNYTITLTVTDKEGVNNTASKLVTVLPQPEGPWLDLYTQKGGLGRSGSSEDFAPGENVVLTALVTYYNVAVSYKMVAFELKDALDEAVLYRSNMTDQNGSATVNFTLRADCLPNLFGTWTAVATVSVSEQKVSDTLTFKVSGPFLDVYTQHPEPYSGRGPNMPSDAFAPQQEVILYGEAHWNCEPVEYKFVSFEVQDPTGQTIDYRTNATNETGVAMVSFRLASNATFGIYKIYGIVEILGRNATDTLTFRVGWIVEMQQIIATDTSGAIKSTFRKEEHVCFNITARNIAFTAKTATFAVVIHDAEGVPIGQITLLEWSILPGASAIFLISIQIPKWSFTGTAVAYANAYTDLPVKGGIPYCPEIFVPFAIAP